MKFHDLAHYKTELQRAYALYAQSKRDGALALLAIYEGLHFRQLTDGQWYFTNTRKCEPSERKKTGFPYIIDVLAAIPSQEAAKRMLEALIARRTALLKELPSGDIRASQGPVIQEELEDIDPDDTSYRDEDDFYERLERDPDGEEAAENHEQAVNDLSDWQDEINDRSSSA